MYSFLKRTFDFLFSFLIIIFLSPFFFLLYIVLLFTTGRPVFFAQVRVGRLSREFTLYKFRTMNNASLPNNVLVTSDNDNRITPIGRLLRKFKIDELPQLFNIMIGDMSFVGPRPEVPLYYNLIPNHYRKSIQTLRPGLTDFASLYYIDESSLLKKSIDPIHFYSCNILPKKTRLQYFYFIKHSFIVDIIILVKTVFAIFSKFIP